MAEYRTGSIVKCQVTGIEKYGAFVNIDGIYSGLIHISEMSHGFVKDIHDFVKVGDIINTEILDVNDNLFQLKLSIKNINYKNVKNAKKKNIIETPSGFKTLGQKLPIWIEESVKKIKN
mgnify:CR=1 FL=1